MKYFEMAIILGNKCTAECDICCLNSNINCNDSIDLEKTKKFILSSEYVDEISTIHFSGGEAFLYYDKLIKLVKCCKSIGKNSTVISNGFWASDYESAYIKLKSLKDAGISGVGVSYDEFHAKYVDIENIRNIIKASKELNVKTSIQAVLTKNANIEGWLSKLGIDAIDVIINFLGCDKVGRAKYKFSDDEFVKIYSPDGCICRKGGTFSVLYDGSIWPCCSPFVYETKLSVGNIYENLDTVEKALDALNNNTILKILRNKGFDFYTEIARDNKLIDIPYRVSSSCELCNLFYNENNINKFNPYIFEKIKKDKNCIVRVKNEL